MIKIHAVVDMSIATVCTLWISIKTVLPTGGQSVESVVERCRCGRRAYVTSRLSNWFGRRTTRGIYHQKRIRGDERENNRSPYFYSPLFFPSVGTNAANGAGSSPPCGPATLAWREMSRVHLRFWSREFLATKSDTRVRRFLGASVGSRITAVEGRTDMFT